MIARALFAVVLGAGFPLWAKWFAYAVCWLGGLNP